MHANRITPIIICALLLLPLAAVSVAPAAATAVPDQPLAADRAGWLLARADGDDAALGIDGLQPADPGDDAPAPPAEIGGQTVVPQSDDDGGPSPAVPMLMSAVLPGLGEAYRGHKRGYVLMALDIAAWIGGFHYKNEGEQLRDDYIAFADEHWSEQKLEAAYNNPPPGGYDDADLQYVELWGRNYFPVQDYRDLDLWVSREDDFREYYENLGKWDQFVFGWDDFVRADDPRLDDPYGPGYVDYEIDDLRQSWTSSNRDTYRQMRTDSNSAFEKQDRFLYVNIFLRVFSVLEVAYLEGLMGGGGSDNELRVAGHPVSIIAETTGWHASRLGAAVEF
jgi:hypothetical protein